MHWCIFLIGILFMTTNCSAIGPATVTLSPVTVPIGVYDSGLDTNFRTTNVSKKCGRTKVSVDYTELQYQWKVKGLVDYLVYINNFDESLTITTEPIQFGNDMLGGQWVFSYRTQKLKKAPDSMNFASATYQYERRSGMSPLPRFNLGASLDIFHDTAKFMLPLRTYDYMKVQQIPQQRPQSSDVDFDEIRPWNIGGMFSNFGFYDENDDSDENMSHHSRGGPYTNLTTLGFNWQPIPGKQLFSIIGGQPNSSKDMTLVFNIAFALASESSNVKDADSCQ